MPWLSLVRLICACLMLHLIGWKFGFALSWNTAGFALVSKLSLDLSFDLYIVLVDLFGWSSECVWLIGTGILFVLGTPTLEAFWCDRLDISSSWAGKNHENSLGHPE
ncbi:hypothetical protein BCR42DRAFT_392295 [Absidia repens]|uniref:Uncharacterized protein n=1 Tax=Absidia repens TaxID=90262 RepID=A0A1X2IGZ0_9FUNG|nr:hypothetical protein BCR42DRAFT_392295 [Absidia repens]